MAQTIQVKPDAYKTLSFLQNAGKNMTLAEIAANFAGQTTNTGKEWSAKTVQAHVYLTKGLKDSGCLTVEEVAVQDAEGKKKIVKKVGITADLVLEEVPYVEKKAKSADAE